MGTEAVVVEVQVLKGHVRGEEGDKRGLGVEAERIVVQVDGVEVRQVKNRREQGGESFRNLVEQTAREDIGKVGNLVSCLVLEIIGICAPVMGNTYPQRLLGGQHFA